MMLVALVLDLTLGWPNWLFVRIGHPVTWIGALISVFEEKFNCGAQEQRLFWGNMVVLGVVGGTCFVAAISQFILLQYWWGSVFCGVLAWPFSAARSLDSHVGCVARPLKKGDLIAARRAVSMIVGRDPEKLDAAGIARAATESLAENTSDGITAPLFWGLIAGFPGIVSYKALNTLDSMIGHRSKQYEAFGKASARLDDVANWIPARITGVFFVLSRPRRCLLAWRVMVRDARKHRSPNAGWPEAGLAGALNIRLSGPRVYETGTSDEPWLNEGAPDPGAKQLENALILFRRVVAMIALCLILCFLA